MRALLICLALAALAGCARNEREASPLDQAAWVEDFSRGMKGWWSEGGRRVWVEEGRLHVDADPPVGEPGNACTVWGKRAVAGDFTVEYDAHVVASGKQANNINFFLCYTDPTGAPLSDSRAARGDGAYKKYHELNGYIITFVNDIRQEGPAGADGSPRARFRLRRCPGFELLDEAFVGKSQAGVTYRCAVTKKGGRLTFAVNGKQILEAVDRQPHAGGLIGLRTWSTHLWWDNIRVTRGP